MILPFPRPVRRSLRQLHRVVLRSHLRLVYHDGYDLTFPDLPNDPLRAERILAFLVSEGLVSRREVHRPEPVWMKSLQRVHTPRYLDSLERPEVLTSVMGASVSLGQVDRTVDFQRLQTGGTLMAVRRARRTGLGVNLGGGYHHAHADQGGGFCLFNDVAVAVLDERERGFRGRVLVVDLDLHDGDGTRSIFRKDPSVHTFSIHARHWDEIEGVETTSIELGSGVDDATYLGAIREHLPGVFDRFRPRLVIYLAGCDPAHDDRLGDWRISADALL
ncbi:MAG: histone deacetylase, partial [Holophagales bacterium]|nr:histone deacetylase [Holophagales bacterium]